MVWSVIAVAFWAMLPAYVPNNAAVLAGGGAPIDGGRTMGDSRLLGDGKTWRGTAVGTVIGFSLAMVLNAINEPASAAIGVEFPTFPLLTALGLAFGAMLGDITASFIKRRSGRERGAAFPGLDQLDFVVGALTIAFLTSPTWFLETFTLEVLLVVAIMTPALHVATNIIAYAIGVKNEPW